MMCASQYESRPTPARNACRHHIVLLGKLLHSGSKHLDAIFEDQHLDVSNLLKVIEVALLSQLLSANPPRQDRDNPEDPGNDRQQANAGRCRLQERVG
jgi:hypothetical protein